jgi:ADP-ribose pyrophosphatase YjhB (NUDIX family)
MRQKMLEVADEIRAIATTGAHFTEGFHDRERYERLLGIAARLAALAGAGDERELLERFRSIDAGYVTPKLDVRMAIFRGDQVLLVQERDDQRWCLPGGYVDIGDSPSEAAERETAEEAGLDCRARKLVGVFDYRTQPEAPPALFHIFKLLFLGEPTDASAIPRAGPEVLAAQWYPLDQLPDLSEGRTLRHHILAALRQARDPGLPAHFD